MTATQQQTTPKSSLVLTPIQTNLLQRKCACGNHTMAGGECEECKKQQTVQRASLSPRGRRIEGEGEIPPMPPIVPEVQCSLGQPLDSTTRTSMEPRFGHHFSQVGLQAPPVRKVKPAYNGKSDCSPTWFGDTSPEVDPSGGSFIGRLIVTYNEAELKDPCVRECVEQHESVHVKHLTPIVKKIHDCDVAAGSDWDKKGKCSEMATRELTGVRLRSECESYQKSFTCLTLKIFDPKSPCSKPLTGNRFRSIGASRGAK